MADQHRSDRVAGLVLKSKIFLGIVIVGTPFVPAR
jgi:hypothetical protein